MITIVFAVGFFLKYAYESGWIGPLGRVLIAAAGGLLALTIGELTRRRGYDFVAKGVTALGFAILYATVFAAHRWYGLLGPAPAYVLAVRDHRGGHALRGRPGRSHRGRAVADRRLYHPGRAVPGREPADLAVQLRPDSQSPARRCVRTCASGAPSASWPFSGRTCCTPAGGSGSIGRPWNTA